MESPGWPGPSFELKTENFHSRSLFHFLIRRVEELGLGVKGEPHLLLDPGQAAGHMAFRMAEDIADPIKRPAGILPKSQHREISPFAFIRVGKVIVNQLPEFIGSSARQNNFGSITTCDRHVSAPKYHDPGDAGPRMKAMGLVQTSIERKQQFASVDWLNLSVAGARRTDAEPRDLQDQAAHTVSQDVRSEGDLLTA